MDISGVMPWQRVGRWHWGHSKKCNQQYCPTSSDICIYNVSDLLLHGLENNLPSIQLLTYTSADIDKVNKLIHRLDGAVGTMKLHEIFVQ